MSPRYLAIAVLLVSRIILADSPVAADDEKEKLIATLKEIDALVQDGGIPAAVKKIESLGDPSKVMRTYFIVTNHFYRNKHDVAGMFAFGQAGMAYLLDQASQAGKTDPAQADKLKGFAKSMAYNISVNAWPGWNEKGIEITRDQSKAAYQAALENLRLAVELKRPADVMGNAHWLIGAQHLALDRPLEAVDQFQKAVQQYAIAQKPDYQHMAEGYTGIALLTQAASRDRGRKTLDKAISDLEARKTSDANFFASQLKAVEKVFGNSPTNELKR